MKALRPPPAASPVTYLFRFRCPRDSPLLRARCCQRSRGGEGPSRARIIVQPAILIAGSLSRGREWNISGSQATHPVPLPRSKTPVESTFLANSGTVDAAPASVTTKASALLISGLPRGFSTCCLRFKDGVATATCKTRFRLAGWPLPGGSSTHWFAMKGFRVATSLPPFLALPDARWLRARRHACGGSRDDDVRGEPACGGTNIRVTSLYAVGEDPDHDAVMRIAAKAPRRRTHSAQRHRSRRFRRDPATSNRHRQPVTSCEQGPKPSEVFLDRALPSVRRTEDDTLGHDAVAHEVPQGDEKLARQGHNHLLARGAGVLGANFKPFRQGALLLESKKAPRQLDHPPPHPTIAGSGEPLLPASAATFVGRARQPSVARHGAPIAQVARQDLLDQHVRRLNANADHTHQNQDHQIGSGLRGLLQLLQSRLLDLLDLLGDELLSRKVALQFGERVGRNELALGRAQLFEALRRLFEVEIEVANA